MTLDEVFKEASKGCQVPGCTHKHGEIVLNSGCHPGANMRVSVDAGRGVMLVACGVCNRAVLTINHTMSN